MQRVCLTLRDKVNLSIPNWEKPYLHSPTLRRGTYASEDLLYPSDKFDGLITGIYLHVYFIPSVASAQA